MEKSVTKIHDSPYGGSPHNFHIARHGDELIVEITYPPRSDEGNPNDQVRYVQVDQESVRASDGVRLFYDYERDGWVIQQASRFSWATAEDANAPTAEDWQEVAFIESWARQETDEEESLRVDGPAPAETAARDVVVAPDK